MPLTITRKDGQSVEVSGPARITVYKNRADRVQLVIEAAPEVKILRTELRDTPAKEDDTDEFELGGESG